MARDVGLTRRERALLVASSLVLLVGTAAAFFAITAFALSSYSARSWGDVAWPAVIPALGVALASWPLCRAGDRVALRRVTAGQDRRGS